MAIRVYHMILTFVISCFAWPIWWVANNYILTQFDTKHIALCTLIGSVVSMIGLFLIAGLLSRFKSCIFNVIVTFVVTCMVAIIIFLETRGIIKGFVTLYLKYAEVYADKGYGLAFVLYDAIGFHIVYYIIIYQMFNGIDWRSMSIYLGSGLATRHCLLMFAYLVEYLPFTACSWINLPYILFPAYILHRAFTMEVPKHHWNHHTRRGWKLVILDIFLVLASLACIVITVIKGGIVLSKIGNVTHYSLNFVVNKKHFLSFINPDRISVFQQVIYLMYSTPIHLAVIYYLVRPVPKPQFLWDICVLHAGIVMPGQFCYVVAALLPNSPKEFQQAINDYVFWLVSLVILIVPHLHVWRLSIHQQGKREGPHHDPSRPCSPKPVEGRLDEGSEFQSLHKEHQRSELGIAYCGLRKRVFYASVQVSALKVGSTTNFTTTSDNEDSEHTVENSE